MKKFTVNVTGTVTVTVEAETEDQAFERVQAVCCAEANPVNFGIDGEEALAMTQLHDWYIDIPEEVEE